MHDHGVASVRFVGDWRLLLALCYDNCLRAYDTDTGNCKFEQANENRCMFTSLEVDGRNGEVRLHLHSHTCALASASPEEQKQITVAYARQETAALSCSAVVASTTS